MRWKKSLFQVIPSEPSVTVRLFNSVYGRLLFDLKTRSFLCQSVCCQGVSMGNLKLTPFPLEGGQVIWTNSPILQAAVPAKGLRIRKDDTTVNSRCLRSVSSIRITIWRRQWPIQTGLLIYSFLAMLHGMRDFSSRIRDRTGAAYTGHTVSSPLDNQGSPLVGLLYFDYLPFL